MQRPLTPKRGSCKDVMLHHKCGHVQTLAMCHCAPKSSAVWGPSWRLYGALHDQSTLSQPDCRTRWSFSTEQATCLVNVCPPWCATHLAARTSCYISAASRQLSLSLSVCLWLPGASPSLSICWSFVVCINLHYAKSCSLHCNLADYLDNATITPCLQHTF